MRIGLYNRHLGTLGGGERHSLAIAARLSRGQPVDVLSHTPVSREAIGARLRLDLVNVRLRVVPELLFVYDDSPERAARIDELLRQIAAERATPAAGAPSPTPDAKPGDGAPPG